MEQENTRIVVDLKKKKKKGKSNSSLTHLNFKLY